MSSLRRRLLLWLLPATFLAGLLASIGTYWGAVLELDDLLNDQMRYLAEHINVDSGERVVLTDTGKKNSPFSDDNADEVLLQVWNAGVLSFTTDSALTLPPPQQTGLNDVQVGDQTWHAFVSQRGDKFIRVAQAQNKRWEELAGLAVHLLWPLVSLIPFLALFLWFGISYGLKPLRTVAIELSERNVNSLQPIASKALPGEVKPLVDALNDLLERLADAFTMQKHFIADAAHELRTPVAALSIQVELAQRATFDEDRQILLSQVQAGVTRLTHLTQQLLTLARLEPDAQSPVIQRVDLSALCKSVISDQVRRAEASGIDLGLVEHAALCILGDPETLRILLNNLVDNAIRYAGAHTKIDLAVRNTDQGIVLEVCDNGPGINAAERERVLERFYRGNNQIGTGSGLGLSIVKTIAEKHGAQVGLDATSNGSGLRVQITFLSKSEKYTG
ncbi:MULTISPECIES: ATP-binding protein [unclassified Pseudomonas]|uniref:ATP-binding protein n=1 Tax=unclassified Pseudomonas TaxID=196821 RepID=UPI002AC9390F|nr:MULTISPECIES: ATP-binding protein [unclassified Pseudomonas]MEB0042065.1 ATP-binding protein [Pseudomonas sp. MH10]MEB0076551.1 ATP-binding protein [Pseudomonas sp. MH10out]MEB0091299.1 ATP-binding protein [Pseudomonas sp. CCI4.2]MEB0101507.1 ATP-binding protein [Pseudomonas sp. CCI3.2]MEB0119789.1 ATP-binding protein [Pseudomonas sp. CCI1.2]